MSFANKVVIVTGASSGIGEATAIHFGKLGADVVLVGRNETRLNNVAKRVADVGKTPLIVKADVSKTEDAKRVIQDTVNKYGKIDVLVNNAGIVLLRKIDEDNLVEVYDQIFATNLRSVVLLTNLAAPYLKKTKGNIVNIASIAGKSTLGNIAFGNGPYCASKAAMEHFSRSSATELAEFGVRVNIVSPGPVETPILTAGGEDNVDMGALARKVTALGHLTQPEEVARMIAFVAHDDQKSVTGADFIIDSGYLVKGERNVKAFNN